MQGTVLGTGSIAGNKIGSVTARRSPICGDAKGAGREFPVISEQLNRLDYFG